jgi:DNA-binding NarL/FixJ family response regulator
VSEMIRLLVADNEPSVRQGLRMALGLEPDMTVVGEAADGRAALALAALTHPDVIVMDLEMPGMDGAAATTALHAADESPPVVMLSIHYDAANRLRALAAGAAAYVDKGAGLDPLLAAIRGAAAP